MVEVGRSCVGGVGLSGEKESRTNKMAQTATSAGIYAKNVERGRLQNLTQSFLASEGMAANESPGEVEVSSTSFQRG